MTRFSYLLFQLPVPTGRKPLFLHLTTQEVLDSFKRKGIDLQAAGILYDALVQSLNQANQSDATT